MFKTKSELRRAIQARAFRVTGRIVELDEIDKPVRDEDLIDGQYAIFTFGKKKVLIVKFKKE